MTPRLLSRWTRALLRLTRTLWFRVTLFALLSVATAALAIVLEDRIPAALARRFSPDAVLPILTILASGMLAVSTFSLNVMVTAHNAAAGQTTPRVHRVLLEDTTTHTVLAIFVGAFVYALSAIILFKAGLYPPGASVIVLAITAAVVVVVVMALLRWIHRLSDLGSLDATLATIEAAARPCLMRVRESPALGAHVSTRDRELPAGARPVPAPATGHLQLIDMPGLDHLCSETGTQLHLHVRPGDYVIEGAVIGHLAGPAEVAPETIASHLTIAAHRGFEQDASYGLLVLSETAARALSPGINDPGTAITVIARLERLLLEWAQARPGSGAPLYSNLFLPEISRAALIESAFAQSARDGASQIEVAVRLRMALLRLGEAPDPDLAEAARAMAAHALDHADAALALDSDRARLRATGDGLRLSP